MTTNTPALISIATGKPMDTQLSEVAPGQWEATAIHPNDVPRYALVRLMRQGDGSYIPVVKSHAQYVRMSSDLPMQVGMKDLSVKTLYRLIAAGFIASSKPGPGGIMVDLLSLAEHIEAARDPEFWTPARRKRFSDACAEIH